MRLQGGWGGGLRKSPGWGESMSQVDGASDMVPTCWLSECMGVGIRKGTIASASTFVGQKATPSPSALALMPDSLVPLFMSLVLFKLLPRSWSSEGVSLSKSM